MTVEDRSRLIERLSRARRISARLDVTSRAGEALRFAREAVDKGTKLVVAWGGDGTINEVGSALVGSPVALGVVPSGSGNGFARTLSAPTDPEAAIVAALDGSNRTIDVGVIDDRYFFNVAGIGLDAVVAGDFNRTHAGQRGLAGYVRAAVPSVLRYSPASYAVDWDQLPFTGRAFMLVFANGREYGNGFVVAPDADPADGLLDVAIVAATTRPRDVLRALRFGLTRRLGDDSTVTGRCRQVTVVSDRPMWFHVDGEAFEGGRTLRVSSHPAALVVRYPTGTAGPT